MAGLAQRKDEDALRATDGAGWATGKDTYGEVTYLKLPAGRPGSWDVQP